MQIPRILDGRPVAAAISEATRLALSNQIRPVQLAIIQMGNEAASSRYVGLKQRYGKDLGVAVRHVHVPVSRSEALRTTAELNADPDTAGIILQLPLPKPEWTSALVEALTPSKDVDGLGSKSQFPSATAAAVMALFDYYKISLAGSRVALWGHGRLVGRPLLPLLERAGARVCVLEAGTARKAELSRLADIVIGAVGQPGLITSEMVGPGAIVIDVGVAESAGALVGDVDPTVRERADIRITPEKGGVGPITVACLFAQLLEAASQQNLSK